MMSLENLKDVTFLVLDKLTTLVLSLPTEKGKKTVCKPKIMHFFMKCLDYMTETQMP